MDSDNEENSQNSTEFFELMKAGNLYGKLDT